jgi:membrane protein YdbS with pleckstrin-like domain
MHLWPRTILYVLYAIAPPAIVAFILSKTDSYDGMAATIFMIVSAVWILYWGIRALLNWYRYHNDTWTITNQRIVDCFRTTPFNLRISTADLVNIQDMSVDRHGPLQTMLNYGDVVCETAGAGGNRRFVLAGIPAPQDVQLLVDKERDRERSRGR